MIVAIAYAAQTDDTKQTVKTASRIRSCQSGGLGVNCISVYPQTKKRILLPGICKASPFVDSVEYETKPIRENGTNGLKYERTTIVTT